MSAAMARRWHAGTKAHPWASNRPGLRPGLSCWFVCGAPRRNRTGDPILTMNLAPPLCRPAFLRVAADRRPPSNVLLALGFHPPSIGPKRSSPSEHLRASTWRWTAPVSVAPGRPKHSSTSPGRPRHPPRGLAPSGSSCTPPRSVDRRCRRRRTDAPELAASLVRPSVPATSAHRSPASAARRGPSFVRARPEREDSQVRQPVGARTSQG